MTPTVGRIVHMVVNPDTNNYTDVAPAVITRVWSDEMVNVRVLLDQAETPWFTSVHLYDSRQEDTLTPHAFWPPKV